VEVVVVDVDVVVDVVEVEVVAALLISVEKLDVMEFAELFAVVVVVAGLNSAETDEGVADGVWDVVSEDVFWMSEELLTTSAAEAELIVFFCVVLVFSLMVTVVVSTQIQIFINHLEINHSVPSDL